MGVFSSFGKPHLRVCKILLTEPCHACSVSSGFIPHIIGKTFLERRKLQVGFRGEGLLLLQLNSYPIILITMTFQWKFQQ